MNWIRIFKPKFQKIRYLFQTRPGSHWTARRDPSVAQTRQQMATSSPSPKWQVKRSFSEDNKKSHEILTHYLFYPPAQSFYKEKKSTEVFFLAPIFLYSSHTRHVKCHVISSKRLKKSFMEFAQQIFLPFFYSPHHHNHYYPSLQSTSSQLPKKKENFCTILRD